MSGQPGDRRALTAEHADDRCSTVGLDFERALVLAAEDGTDETHVDASDEREAEQ